MVKCSRPQVLRQCPHVLLLFDKIYLHDDAARNWGRGTAGHSGAQRGTAGHSGAQRGTAGNKKIVISTYRPVDEEKQQRTTQRRHVKGGDRVPGRLRYGLSSFHAVRRCKSRLGIEYGPDRVVVHKWTPRAKSDTWASTKGRRAHHRYARRAVSCRIRYRYAVSPQRIFARKAVSVSYTTYL